MSIENRLLAKLTREFASSWIDIVNESHLHAGHAHGGTESHFRVKIVSPAFDGKSRVERQRLVYAVLAEELAGPVHALSVHALTPAENAASG